MAVVKVLVLGGTGFVGSELVREAVAQGIDVRALARSDDKAEGLQRLGARAVVGDMDDCQAWIDAARGCDVVVDLTQPTLPPRIGLADIKAAAAARLGGTRRLLEALVHLPAGERPLLFCVSGTDDLAPDPAGCVDASSPPKSPPTGFGHIGVPVRALVEASGVSATFLYLGTVYGPGKSFASTVFPRLAQGQLVLPAPADNHWPLIHVRDAAAAIAHLAQLDRGGLLNRSFLLVDESGGTRLRAFFDRAADLIGARAPRRLPAWLLAPILGRALLDSLRRDMRCGPSDLLRTGFRFAYPTMREGLPPTLEALGYRRQRAAEPTPPRLRRSPWLARLLFAASLVALVGVNTVDTPLTVPGLSALAGGQRPLDLRLGYGSEAARSFLSALGPVGRARYFASLWTLDLVLPLLFGLCLWTMIDRGRLSRWRWLGLLAAVADYCENASISLLIVRFPALLGTAALVASTLTTVKFFLYFAALAVAAVGARRRSRAV